MMRPRCWDYAGSLGGEAHTAGAAAPVHCHWLGPHAKIRVSSRAYNLAIARSRLHWVSIDSAIFASEQRVKNNLSAMFNCLGASRRKYLRQRAAFLRTANAASLGLLPRSSSIAMIRQVSRYIAANFRERRLAVSKGESETTTFVATNLPSLAKRKATHKSCEMRSSSGNGRIAFAAAVDMSVAERL